MKYLGISATFVWLYISFCMAVASPGSCWGALHSAWRSTVQHSTILLQLLVQLEVSFVKRVG